MFPQLFYARLLLQRLLIVLLLFSGCRIFFFLFNQNIFSSVSIADFLLIMVYGLRFDISAVIYLNGLFILLHLLPFPFRTTNAYQQIQKIIFILFNSIALLFEIADFIYFRFTHKRTSADIFYIASDVANLLPQYLKDFWYLLFIWGGLILLALFLYKKTEAKIFNGKTNYFYQTILLFLSLGIFLIGGRGGLQLKPITPITAAQYVDVSLTSLVTNTTFNIQQSIEHKGLDEKNYFPNDEVKKLYSFHHFTKSSKDNFRNENVMIIIMESFSKEYVGYFNNGAGYTPFLDSLLGEGLACTNAFANAQHSNEGLVAIIAGIPALMMDPLMVSNYQNNRFSGIGSEMKNKKYTTAFFHGGINGTFGFDYFSKSAGLEYYFGKTEYANENDFDGSWGIYDEPFFQYVAKTMDGFQQPFCAVLFSVSSHHPYKIPNKYKNEFQNKIPRFESVRYADYSLRKFFETISKKDWFQHTLFVITADHTGESYSDIYKNTVGNYKIPILFYKADGSLKGVLEKPAQHIDIMPSILDYLNFDKNYFSFGKSVFDTVGKRFVYTFNNGIYQILDNEFVLQFDGEKSIALFDYKNDMLLTTNLLKEKAEIASLLEKQIKAVIQTYNHSMIHNKLSIE